MDLRESCRCPRCRKGSIYNGFITLTKQCSQCGFEISKHDSGDGPAVFLIFVLGFLNSKFLTPLNKLWYKFGIFLGSIVSPIVMGAVFFIVVTPIGLIMRLLGKDLLRINKSKLASTYWIKRDKQHSTMKKQF